MNKFMINPFHLVQMSPWPLMGALGALFTTLGMTSLFHLNELKLLFLGLLVVTMTMGLWWRDVTRESTMQGFHTDKTYKGLRLGMLLFILSEVCFFFAFFWAFFHSALAPTHEIGLSWPPTSISTFSPWGIPLLNTVVLLSSGAFITWSHHAMLYQNKRCNSWSLSFTIAAGMYFSYLQAMEYSEASFSIADSVYGTCFFVTTGFHGLHVLIGTVFLMIMSLRNFMLHFSSNHHLGFEAAAWYWHFVDVVWLFLFVSIYWWGY